MDLSKLPKLSQTPARPPAEDSANPAPPSDAAPTTNGPCPHCHAPLPAGTRFCGSCGKPAVIDCESPRIPGVGAEVWISAIVGLIFLLVGRRFGAYLLAKLSGRTIHTGFDWTSGPQAGSEVAYWDLQGHAALSESAMFLFGAALVLDALALAIAASPIRIKAPFVMLALILSISATLYNLFAAVVLFRGGQMPLFSILAIGIGGYIALCDWSLFRRVRRA